MTSPQPAWRKSSRSASNAGQCVEVAQHKDDVAVRDSKQPTNILTIDRAEWAAFLVSVKKKGSV